MRKTFMTLLFRMVCSLALAAGQYGDQPQASPQTAPSSSSMGKSVTIIGCLQSGTEPNSYVLSNAMPSDTSQQSQIRSERTPSEMARTEDSYTLIPEGRVDLKKHVGHKVEVTGKVAEKSSRTSAQTEQSSEMTGHPHFKVASIREIAQSCQE